ncbi:MAG: 5-(carboxyamino)imidazole ribonucleotide mutase [Firmicutes bacterium]|jgi:5-(carboxyamino)imidazole ribonucleotide mutase|nr:5-(carboxyamino)imidazole ribonucleotide mutase [Bacillota bacterium]
MPDQRVSIIMGSDSDWEIMQAAEGVLREFAVAYEVRVVSAHRTPQWMADYADTAHSRGIAVIIAAAGGAAHLPGMIAAHTPIPVIGVPIPSRHLQGLDSLLSIVQMPSGVPVATVAIGGAGNAALLAISIISLGDEALFDKLVAYRKHLAEASMAKDLRLGHSSESTPYEADPSGIP